MQTTENTALIAHFFSERGFEINSDSDLFESGAIDSMGIIELVVFLEEKLGVSLDAAQMTADNFRTLNAILALIENRHA